jgi:hypothetical protein
MLYGLHILGVAQAVLCGRSRVFPLQSQWPRGSDGEYGVLPSCYLVACFAIEDVEKMNALPEGAFVPFSAVAGLYCFKKSPPVPNDTATADDGSTALYWPVMGAGVLCTGCAVLTWPKASGAGPLGVADKESAAAGTTGTPETPFCIAEVSCMAFVSDVAAFAAAVDSVYGNGCLLGFCGLDVSTSVGLITKPAYEAAHLNLTCFAVCSVQEQNPDRYRTTTSAQQHIAVETYENSTCKQNTT